VGKGSFLFTTCHVHTGCGAHPSLKGVLGALSPGVKWAGHEAERMCGDTLPPLYIFGA